MKTAFVPLLLLLAWPAAAADKPKGGPQAPPEAQKLEYFKGHWQIEGEMKPGPMGAGGKVTGSERCRFFPGHFHLVCRSKAAGPLGEMKSLAILSWLPLEKRYAYYAIDNHGTASPAQGTLAGDLWTWTGSFSSEGKTIHSRFSLTQVPPSGYTYKWEMSPDEKAWSVVAEGKGTRAPKGDKDKDDDEDDEDDKSRGDGKKPH